MNAVLEQLIPERLLVWYVSKDEPANKEMHFYAGRYSIESLELATPSERVAAVNQYALALPALNTLLPESFDIRACLTHTSKSYRSAEYRDMAARQ